jgi:hypothetical protein
MTRSSLLVFGGCALVFGWLGACRSDTSSGGGTTQTPSCDGLAACCAQIVDQGTKDQCTDVLGQAKASAAPEANCASTLATYNSAGVCSVATGGTGGGGTGGSGAGGAGGTSGDGGNCTPGPENTEAACGDGCDNDGNNFIDCDDFACGVVAACVKPAENSNPKCSDGVDNDTDGKIDCDDFDCQDRKVCAKEATNANCSDGDDNDGDSATDCADEDCQQESIVVCNGATPVSPLPAESEWEALITTKCTDGTDNDTNTFTDCDDFSCTKNQEATV